MKEVIGTFLPFIIDPSNKGQVIIYSAPLGPTNKHRYVLAAQSPSLRQFARQVPGTPIVHVKRSVMVLEPASEATEKAKSTVSLY